VERRLHQEVLYGRVHPHPEGFREKDIQTPRGEGLVRCWELINDGGQTRDVIAFLKSQSERLGRRVTAIVRTRKSTWIMDVGDRGVRISHFPLYPPCSIKVGEAMKRYWAKKKAMGGET
jgi:hypothetical protein